VSREGWAGEGGKPKAAAAAAAAAAAISLALGISRAEFVRSASSDSSRNVTRFFELADR